MCHHVCTNSYTNELLSNTANTFQTGSKSTTTAQQKIVINSRVYFTLYGCYIKIDICLCNTNTDCNPVDESFSLKFCMVHSYTGLSGIPSALGPGVFSSSKQSRSFADMLEGAVITHRVRWTLQRSNRLKYNRSQFASLSTAHLTQTAPTHETPNSAGTTTQTMQ